MTGRSDGAGASTRPPRRSLGELRAVAPGVITAMHERRAGSSRFVVAIDGHIAATVSAELIGELGLRVGRRVDETEAARLSQAAARLEVFDKAVELLSVRARSVRDLTARLRRAGAGDDAIAGAVERLRGLGFLDDEAFARQLARSRVLSGGVSKRRIGVELQNRGIARDVADTAISETLADVDLDEDGAARAAALKRLRALTALDPATRRRRLYAFLARRGYAPDVIARVLREVIGDRAMAESTDDFAEDGD